MPEKLEDPTLTHMSLLPMMPCPKKIQFIVNKNVRIRFQMKTHCIFGTIIFCNWQCFFCKFYRRSQKYFTISKIGLGNLENVGTAFVTLDFLRTFSLIHSSLLMQKRKYEVTNIFWHLAYSERLVWTLDRYMLNHNTHNESAAKSERWMLLIIQILNLETPAWMISRNEKLRYFISII